MTDAGARTPPCPRLLVERFSGRFWAWLDREEFLVPKNVLDIVAGQTITWMGLFYCPLLPLLNSVFIFLTFHIKKVRARAGRGRHAPGWAMGPPRPQGRPRVLLLPAPSASLPGASGSLASANWLTTPMGRCLPPVHPHEELQGLSSAIPGLQLHLLLPAGAPPGPAPGRHAPGLCGQQVRAAERPWLVGR